MYIIGDANDAEEVAKAVLIKMKTIFNETVKLQEDLKRLEESFQDTGVNEVKSVIAQVTKEISNYLDDAATLSRILKEYAEILRRR